MQLTVGIYAAKALVQDPLGEAIAFKAGPGKAEGRLGNLVLTGPFNPSFFALKSCCILRCHQYFFLDRT